MKEAPLSPAVKRPPVTSRTRQSLFDAGKRLMASGKLDAASIDDIVREADVAKGSFYNHFTDRESLIDDVAQTLMADLQAAVFQAQAGVEDPAELLVCGLLASFRFGMDNRMRARAMLRITPDSADPKRASNTLLATHLQAGMSQGLFKADRLDAAIVLVLGLTDLGLARLLDLQDEFQQARSVMHDLCVTLLRALGVDGRRIERTVDTALLRLVDGPRAAAQAAPWPPWPPPPQKG